MNKFKLNILAWGIAGICLAGCGDSFLDVESKTESNTGNFYKTKSDAWRALIGCYDGWQATSSDGGGVPFYMASEVMSDECFGATGHTDGRNYQAIDRFDLSQSPSDLNLYETQWTRYYAAVYRCNELLQHEGQINWEGDSRTRKMYMGECRALRAICYFDMARLWGNIPLLTVPTSENVPQADPEDVFNLIFEDLKYAADSIPADAYPKSEAATNDGHINCYAAKALLARAYLFYTGYYGKEPAKLTKAEVLAGLEDVIANSGCDLVGEFKNLWPAASHVSKPGDAHEWDMEKTTYAGDGNIEVVLAQKFNYTDDRYNTGALEGNGWLVMMGLRTFNASPYATGWGACTVNPKMWAAYEDGDTRREASIINFAAEGIESKIDFLSSSLSGWREYTGYGVKKYLPLCYADGETAVPNRSGSGAVQEYQYQNFVVMRFADVLLMAAELGSSNAQTYLDRVRTRAGLTSVPCTLENIRKERMLEFAFEGIRYWDLLRYGLDYAASQIETDCPVKSGNVDDRVKISASKFQATKGLSQIPGNQVTLSNGVLKQNDGWK